jgi:murein DD-endopeptidase MepM/ murein hydrolase activator NlpD
VPSQPRHQSAQSLKRFTRLSAKASGAMRTSQARRAIEEIEKDKRGWLRHGIAALAIAGLGLGVAGAVAVTGSANESHPGSAPGVSIAQSAQKQAPLTDRTTGTSRSAQRQQLNSGANSTDNGTGNGTNNSTGEPLDGTVDMAARQAAQKNAKVTDTTQQDSDATAAAQARAKALESTAGKTEKLSSKLSKQQHQRELSQSVNGAQPANAGGNDSTSTAGDGQAHLPINAGDFTIAARFGQVGAWARYHTGLDFAAPIGTPIHATANGVITNAGYGSASAWAGNYVVIKFSNGQQMLFAHMSSVSVSTGQQVSGGQLIGHVGMTGRAFGPHTHVELYPAGITPGDVYSAVDPAPWFRAHGLSV